MISGFPFIIPIYHLRLTSEVDEEFEMKIGESVLAARAHIQLTARR